MICFGRQFTGSFEKFNFLSEFYAFLQPEKNISGRASPDPDGYPHPSGRKVRKPGIRPPEGNRYSSGGTHPPIPRSCLFQTPRFSEGWISCGSPVQERTSDSAPARAEEWNEPSRSHTSRRESPERCSIRKVSVPASAETRFGSSARDRNDRDIPDDR